MRVKLDGFTILRLDDTCILKERGHFGDLAVDERTDIRMDFREMEL
jgi:hypothetical protein